MRRRRVLTAVAALVVLALAAIGGAVAWRALPYRVPDGEQARPASVARQSAYLRRWWRSANPEYGRYPATDCVNFVSQALHARGWPMTEEWGTSVTLGRRASTPTWVSSTAMARWFERRPDLARPVSATEVRVGDVAQFDWDGSGDRDHTAVVSRIDRGDGVPRVLVAEHSPSGLYDPVEQRLAEHGPAARVYYWRLLR